MEDQHYSNQKVPPGDQQPPDNPSHPSHPSHPPPTCRLVSPAIPEPKRGQRAHNPWIMSYQLHIMELYLVSNLMGNHIVHLICHSMHHWYQWYLDSTTLCHCQWQRQKCIDLLKHTIKWQCHPSCLHIPITPCESKCICMVCVLSPLVWWEQHIHLAQVHQSTQFHMLVCNPTLYPKSVHIIYWKLMSILSVSDVKSSTSYPGSVAGRSYSSL